MPSLRQLAGKAAVPRFAPRHARRSLLDQTGGQHLGIKCAKLGMPGPRAQARGAAAGAASGTESVYERELSTGFVCPSLWQMHYEACLNANVFRIISTFAVKGENYYYEVARIGQANIARNTLRYA